MLLIQNLGVHFAGTYLFEGVNFRINKNDKIGLAGKNGAGKSTLLKILSGEQKPSEGLVSKEGEISIGYLKQDLDFTKGRTVLEETKTAFEEINFLHHKIDEINEQLVTRTDYESDEYHQLIQDLTDYTERFSHLGGYETEGDIEKILKGLGFKNEDFNRLTDDFSGGWRMRIELAKLLLQKHDVLLLDEPTNHLDIESIVWLEQFLLNYPGAVVLVSHDKQFLSTITNRTIEIGNKTIEDYKAPYAKYIELRKERKEKLVQTQKNQEQYIKHTEELINKFRAKANKASMAQSLIKKLDKIDVIEVQDEDITRLNIKFIPSINPGKVIFHADKLSKSYGDKTIFKDAEFFIERNDKIAFLGQNGQGKTTLAKILADVIPYEGTLHTGHNVQIGYFAQNQEEVLNPKNTVLQEAEDAATEETRPRVRDLLGAFMFRGDEVEKRVQVLSGGERNRLALCKLLLRPFNVLIMDEPTNHLDLHSKEIIKEALKNFAGTLITISHDREFIDGLAEKIFEFRNGEIKEFLGNVTEYLDYRQKENIREIELEKSDNSSKSKDKQGHKPIEKTKEDKTLNNKISKIEAEISDLERKIKQMEDDFSVSNPEEKSIILYEELKNKLTEKLSQWEEILDMKH